MKSARNNRSSASINTRNIPMPSLHRAAASTCETLESRTLFSTYTVTSQGDDGQGSLREAIQLSNASTGEKDTINFNIDLGFQDDDNAIDIHLQSQLPEITDPVTIDATSERTYLFGAAAGANADGLLISAGDTKVIGLGFAGFGGAAVHLTGNGGSVGNGNTLQNNQFGLVLGVTTEGNHEGIRIDNSSQNHVENNLIISCGADGIVVDNANDNLFLTNNIGVRYDDVASANGGSGIHITGLSDNTGISDSVISSNAGSGIWIEGATNTKISKCIIGLDWTKVLNRGNGLDGVRIDQNGASNVIGAGLGNFIAFNLGAGVNVISGTRNAIHENDMHDNVGLGIDLGNDGVTPNDAGDSDAGANNLLNHPIVTKATSDGTTNGVVHVVFDGTPSTAFILELFQVTQPDAGSGEGEFLIYSNTFATDVNGHFGFDLVTAKFGANKSVSATLTDAAGNTSEFSAAQLNDGVVPPKQNTNPDAKDDSAQTAQDTPVTIDVLANDTDADNDTVSLSAFTQAAHGTVTVSGTKLVYTPTAGYSGPDSFGYTVTDGNTGTDTATVTVNVTPAVPPKLNKDPIAKLDSVTTYRGQPVDIQVLKNDSDPDGDPIVVSGASGGMHGMTSRSGGTLTYTSTGTFTGVDTFSYFIADGKGGMATGTVKVTVKANTVPEVAMVTDPANPGSQMLQIIGTEKADTILVKKGNVPNSSVVTANGKNLGTFATDRAIIYALAGDDKITIDAAITSPEWIDAGEGKDTVAGASGDDLILGGGGEDKLYGKAGRDILLGGHQGDLLDGGAGEDLLVAGTLNGDGDIMNLTSLSKEWSRTDLSFAQRLDHIRNGGATSFNGTTRINASTASSGASPVDTLTGGSESDGFFYNFDQKSKNHDKVTDLTASDKGIDIG